MPTVLARITVTQTTTQLLSADGDRTSYIILNNDDPTTGHSIYLSGVTPAQTGQGEIKPGNSIAIQGDPTSLYAIADTGQSVPVDIITVP